MDKDYPFTERDISWLSFNHRVLQEARDITVPLFERIKFMAIYSSNLGEFFAVRVAQQRNLLRISKKTKKELAIHPRVVLKNLLKIVNQQQEEFNEIFDNQLVPELGKHNIFLKRRLELNEEQKTFIEAYFNQNMLPYVQPVLLVKNKIRPFLANSALYLTVMMRTKGKERAPLQYAIVKIPSDYLPRFLELPSEEGRHDVIMLDDIVRYSISWLFPGFDVHDTYSIKLTRDAELYIDDEFSGDLIQKIKDSLQRRDVGPASRLVYDRSMPKEALKYLQSVLELENYDLLPEGRYHNNFDFFKFPDFGMDHLKRRPLEPLPYLPIERSSDIFSAISQKDHLLHLPYQRYDSVVKLFETAAADPQVTHIKIIQYRVGKKSSIMEALMDAVAKGKRVSVFVEVKARFDEEDNLHWGEKLAEAGVKVNYSFPGLKVHAKAAIIRRIENGEPKLYAFLSTGNFHEITAKIYSDLGLFTANHDLCTELARVFSILETRKIPQSEFNHLLVGQFNLRSELVSLINHEIKAAEAGRPSGITLKMNSLQDADMIELLYEASQKGVKIRLIIRGICCLVPGVKGVSENITAISIVDRYLEHARIFIFHNDGDEKIYLSSADWMTRNLSFRVETAFPINDPAIRKTINDLIDLQMNDNVKARIIDKNAKNNYVDFGNDIQVQSQIETYYYLKRKTEMLLDKMSQDEPKEISN
ncbi:MAG: polyphosphate kinase 1 [Saprospiraceae bacterium]|nr:polyphosphate kinase 1 [Saprospiraceae bacterium]